MINALLIDFSRVILFPFDSAVEESLNTHHTKKSKEANYVFLDHFYLNTHFLDFLKTIKHKCHIFIFTSGKLHKETTIQSYLDGIFDGVLETDLLSINKLDSYSYPIVAEKIGSSISEILFIDDQLLHIKAAEFAGMQAILFEDTKQIIECIEKLI